MHTTFLVSALPLIATASLLAQTATWTEVTQPSSPAFVHHDMIYDSARHRLVLAGRTQASGSPCALYAGAADGTWSPLPSPTVPGSDDLELAYDSQRDVVVLYTTATNKVWEFNGTNWSVITAATTPVQCGDGAQLQYDPVRRNTVLVGTRSPWAMVTASSETWLWNGTDWRLAASTNDSPRGGAGGGMAFDTARSEMVLLTMGSMQTWSFNGTNWTQRHPATAPSPGLWAFDLAYDPVSELSVFFGGEPTGGPGGYPQDAWAWNGVNWTKLAPPTAPPSGIDYAFASFPERGGWVLHGGWGDPGWNRRANVWLLTVQSAPQPTLRFTSARVVGGQLSLTSTGRVQTSAAQVLQTSTNLTAVNGWSDAQTNLAPAMTNDWTMPVRRSQEFLRILERP